MLQPVLRSVPALFVLLIASCARTPEPAPTPAPTPIPTPSAVAVAVVPAPPPAPDRTPPAGAHTDHSPHHGGTLLMNGDLHFEVVFDASGQHRVFFSDAVRAALGPAVASSVTLTLERAGEAAEALTLTPDARSWVAAGRPLAAPARGNARLTYTQAGAEPYWIDLPIVVASATPKPAARGKTKHVHDHPHGAHP